MGSGEHTCDLRLFALLTELGPRPPACALHLGLHNFLRVVTGRSVCETAGEDEPDREQSKLHSQSPVAAPQRVRANMHWAMRRRRQCHPLPCSAAGRQRRAHARAQC